MTKPIKEKISQTEFILTYFKKNPNKAIAHAEVVDWAVSEWKIQFDEVLRDPDRAVRKLHQEGQLVKKSKGVYEYDPNYVMERDLEDFSAADKKIILEREGYKCAICGRGTKDGVELQVDHITPKDKGGRASITNGQVLCAQHNFQKKNYNQTTTGKKMFINLLTAAKEIDDKDTIKFCEAILKTFDDFNVNGHIEWKK